MARGALNLGERASQECTGTSPMIWLRVITVTGLGPWQDEWHMGVQERE